ncbi:6-bladed beta-propeller [Dissulfurirhabdus thermomarina]|uniref:6-bladed beta-propeller n=1 Tax=Dissulfurirhabdus thermomarina TaxID=1765737 RepID=A0A6N9TPP7_DISTH|nr:6-bladed beta-propeller [Dissulfurirhabdus thermomarina]NDY41417.1 6-bladed beta-propeller [Dissulfurirhabdus thermomarina]NMX24405.1 6-bladed beta-propeller [Dissulfurirhabdus thermomarina]
MMRRFRRWARPLLIAAVLAACGPMQRTEAPPGAAELLWPAPPAAPRIRWVGEIRDPRDAGVRPGLWDRVKNFLLGGEKGRIARPYGVLHDEADRLFVVDVAGRAVHCMDRGRGLAVTVPRRREDNPLASPIGIAEDASGRVFVTDSETGRIYVFTPGEWVLRPFTPFRLGRPTGIACGTDRGLIYVADTTAHEVVALGPDGRPRFRFGGRGTGPGRFNFPTDLWVDREGLIYVTDALNARIQVFDPEGRFLRQIGRPGKSPGCFAKPKGVAVDGEGHVYVADALFDAIQVFDREGRLLLVFGESGHRPGEFWMPSGLFIDAEDRIYVADTYNRRIQVFQYLDRDANGYE